MEIPYSELSVNEARSKVTLNDIKAIMPWFEGKFSFKFVCNQLLGGSCYGLFIVREEKDELVALAIFQAPVNGDKANLQIGVGNGFSNSQRAELADLLFEDIRQHLLLKDVNGQFHLSGGD